MEYILLGKTVPEPTNERVDQYVCSAGYSPEHGLVRLYPLGLQGTPRRWSSTHVPVERHPGNKDNRVETWKPTGAFGETGMLRKSERRRTLEEFITSGMVEANEKRLSLTLVRPIRPKFYLAQNDREDEPSYQLYQAGEALKAKERFAHHPRLKFLTQDGKRHDLQVRDWGLWELIRKNRTKLSEMEPETREEYVGGSLRITENSLLFLGNYANHRTSWLIISVLNI